MIDYGELCSKYKVALQFSGGKDSLVLLDFMKPYWDSLTVYYLNSGDAFPETEAIVRKAKQQVPNFIEVPGRRLQVEQQFGWSSDIIPVASTWMGVNCGSDNAPLLVDRYTCCYKSIMEPLHEAMKANGVDVILRGQRKQDKLKNTITNGQYADGFYLYYPIDDFSDEDVFNYLVEHGIATPRFYKDGMTSGGDCMHCTAWLEHGQVNYLEKHYPQSHRIVFKRLEKIKETVDASYTNLSSAISTK